MKTNTTLAALTTFLLLFFVSSGIGQQHSVTEIWTTDTVLAVPESVLPNYEESKLYVSLIDGEGWAADGKGGLAELSMDGQLVGQWSIKGLNAPKGLGRIGHNLYFADNNAVAVVNIQTRKLERRINIEGAEQLNDITVSGDNSSLYVSDSKTGIIWKLVQNKATVYLEGINDANGLKCVGEDLYFAKGKWLMKADRDKKIIKIAELPNGIDGIEPVGNGDFLVTAWAGYLYYVYQDGQFETLLDTHDQKRNAADLGYDPQKRIIYLPTFNGKTVSAYQLN